MANGVKYDYQVHPDRFWVYTTLPHIIVDMLGGLNMAT
jgi:hypothetical protein